jgi:hypothetical protein
MDRMNMMCQLNDLGDSHSIEQFYVGSWILRLKTGMKLNMMVLIKVNQNKQKLLKITILDKRSIY